MARARGRRRRFAQAQFAGGKLAVKHSNALTNQRDYANLAARAG